MEKFLMLRITARIPLSPKRENNILNLNVYRQLNRRELEKFVLSYCIYLLTEIFVTNTVMWKSDFDISNNNG
jgi:hypothetical protein